MAALRALCNARNRFDQLGAPLCAPRDFVSHEVIDIKKPAAVHEVFPPVGKLPAPLVRGIARRPAEGNRQCACDERGL